jgi:succinate-semialdehyde dehydrogenase/glutarate-semialdehyde dehydrogenase
MAFYSHNPYTGIRHAERPAASRSEWESQLQNANEAFTYWSHRPMDARGQPLLALAHGLDREKYRLAYLCAEEMGKPLDQGLAEIEKCIRLCAYCRDQAPNALADRIVQEPDLKARVSYRPLGPLLGIMPWNFPIWQTLRFALPALCAGNVVLIKPAPQMLRTSQALDAILCEAYALEGLYQTVYLDVSDMDAFLGTGIVAGVSLTGSARAGRDVGRLAGTHLLPSVLELGGSDPFIVMADAAVEKAVWTAFHSRMANNGQTCLAAKRFILHESVRDTFIHQFGEMLRRATSGAPLEKGVYFSCLARADLAHALQDQLDRAVALGAEPLISMPANTGLVTHIPPALLAHDDPQSPLWKEEVFGPVAVVRTFSTTEEMLQYANDNAYGLGATIWTTHVEAGLEAAASIQAGTVAINGQVRSDPRLPFGGVKQSGYGRELGLEGFRAFCNVQSILLPL